VDRHASESYYVLGEGLLAVSAGGRGVPAKAAGAAAAPPFRFSRMGPEGRGLDDRTTELLGAAMAAGGGSGIEQSNVPAGYTYLGQFIAHDLSFDRTVVTLAANVSPAQLLQGTSPSLDLDSLYGAGPEDPESARFYDADATHLRMGRTAAAGGHREAVGFDLPRGAGSTQEERRRAVIADERVDRRATVVRRLDRPEAQEIAAELGRLAQGVADELTAQRRDPSAQMMVTTTVACRYLGQNYEQEVRTYSGHVDKSYELAIAIAPDAPDFVARLTTGFHAIHRQAYGYDLVDQPIQSVFLGATAVVASALVVVQPYPGVPDGVPPASTRRVLAAAGTWAEASIWKRADLPTGFRIAGPAIVEEPDSTTWIPVGFAAEVHPTSCLVLTRTAEDAP